MIIPEDEEEYEAQFQIDSFDIDVFLDLKETSQPIQCHIDSEMNVDDVIQAVISLANLTPQKESEYSLILVYSSCTMKRIMDGNQFLLQELKRIPITIKYKILLQAQDDELKSFLEVQHRQLEEMPPIENIFQEDTLSTINYKYALDQQLKELSIKNAFINAKIDAELLQKSSNEDGVFQQTKAQSLFLNYLMEHNHQYYGVGNLFRTILQIKEVVTDQTNIDIQPILTIIHDNKWVNKKRGNNSKVHGNNSCVPEIRKIWKKILTIENSKEFNLQDFFEIQDELFLLLKNNFLQEFLANQKYGRTLLMIPIWSYLMNIDPNIKESPNSQMQEINNQNIDSKFPSFGSLYNLAFSQILIDLEAEGRSKLSHKKIQY